MTKANTNAERLIRIEDKVSNMETAIERVEKKLTSFTTEKELAELKKELDEKVSCKEFEPVKNAVYGLIALIVVAVVTAWLTGVIKT